jgi:NAD(P)-dependent dehydrogenase (short-subunit alcohol dehydrogenase family)
MANWLITGVSSGFGRALAEAVLAKGNTVAGTVRNEAAKSEFEKLTPGKTVGILLDVTDQASVHRGAEEAEKPAASSSSSIMPATVWKAP